MPQALTVMVLSEDPVVRRAFSDIGWVVGKHNGPDLYAYIFRSRCREDLQVIVFTASPFYLMYYQFAAITTHCSCTLFSYTERTENPVKNILG